MKRTPNTAREGDQYIESFCIVFRTVAGFQASQDTNHDGKDYDSSR